MRHPLPRSLPAFVVIAILTTGCSFTAPITWDPPELVQPIEPNGFRIAEVTLATGDSVTGIHLRVSGPLREHLHLSPESVVEARANTVKQVRVSMAVPLSATPGQTITGAVEVVAGGRTLNRSLPVRLRIVPSTPEGTLESLRAALEDRTVEGYVRQFVEARRLQERVAFEQLADRALDVLARALQTAERTALSDDGQTAEFKITALLGRDKTVTTIALQRIGGIWYVLHF